MSKILFFDCETTGVPIDYRASYTEVNNWPRVISLAWILADQDGQTVSEVHRLIKPNGWLMPTEEFWIRNGFSQARSEAEGVPIEAVLDMFLIDIHQADHLVAHNINFDHRVVWAEHIRNGKTPRSGLNKICTMAKSTSVCKLPAPRGRGYKWPKLEELYVFLFGQSFDGAHDALADVKACKACFFELLKRKAVTLEIPIS
jgi:DNA polymerase-3 subunit epsilon